MLACLMATAASAATQVEDPFLYDCEITDRQKRVDWVPERMVVIVVPGQPVRVIDPVILTFKEKPQPVRARTRADKLRLTWILSGLVDGAQQFIPSFQYTAVINTNTKAITLRAKPVGFPQSWRGAGQCRVMQEQQLPRNLRNLLRS